MNADDLMDHLRGEIARLTAQGKADREELWIKLRAERAENARLRTAVAHLKEAAGTGHAAIDLASAEADKECFLDSSRLAEVRDLVRELIGKADELLLPLAD